MPCGDGLHVTRCFRVHVTEKRNMADVDAAKALGGLLSGIAQRVYHNNEASIAAADMDPAQLEAFLTAQTRRQGGGGVTAEQAAALSRFWKGQRVRVRESLLAQSRWEPGLRGLSWRVDLQTAASRGGADHGGPVALVELELGRAGQDSDFVCLEFDELKVNQLLKKMADVQESVDRIAPRT
ncbi:COMM domain-containing protein 1 [Liparis tanakae]|uniref:COMM domain-containing protein 1 n=1 Tax=Liparis tanakae TaxID=230148 RepID=A0A4Z2H3Q6_9TELE|nr:COMM domain-containing protein 1 [Liparis tanakae]